MRILVTGARRGIGAALAAGLAGPGHTLVLHHLGAAQETGRVAGRCRARGAEVEIVEADLADPAAVAELSRRPADVLVNNAARPSNVYIAELGLDEWNATFAVNVTAPMLLARALGAGMCARGWGRIVNVTSATVALGGPSGPSYVASKAALIGLTRALAQAYGPYGVTVNALSPGAVQTEGEAELAARTGKNPDRQVLARPAVPRPLVPQDMVETVRLLVSEGSAALTGQVIEVGGGLVYR